MNTNYYNNPTYPAMNQAGLSNGMSHITQTPNNTGIIQNSGFTNIKEASDGMLAIEQSYIENILRLNRGKLATLYFSFPDSVEWRDKTFTGIIEAAGRDHIIVSDPKTGRWYLLLMIYLNYVDFDEKINYSPEYYPSNN